MGRALKVTASVAALAVMLLAFALLDLSYASTPLSLGEVWDVIAGRGTWANGIIVKNVNAPRVVFGVFVGAGLALAGGVMQAVFRNPLASPYILGLSSGASFGAAVSIVFPISFIPAAICQPLLAFAFCFLTMALVYGISRSRGSMVRTETLVLAGVAVSSLVSALVSLLTYVAPSEEMQSIVFWSMGSLADVEWKEMAFAIPIVVVGCVLMASQARSLNAMMLGDAHAMDLGIDVKRVRLALLILGSLVVAACVAFVGTIGFIGLVVPHVFRLLLGPDNRLVLPVSALGGAAFIIMCDYAAHAVAPMYGVLPIGVVTALIGAPFFIYLLCRRKREIGWRIRYPSRASATTTPIGQSWTACPSRSGRGRSWGSSAPTGAARPPR